MNMNAAATRRSPALPRTMRGFTLVEMLVVLGIIGILSAIVVGAVSQVGPKKMISVTKAKRFELATFIELYKTDLGSYPRDNPANPGTNTLFYELTGVLFTNNLVTPANATFTSPLDSTNNLTSAQLNAVFGTVGILNVARPGSRPKSYIKNPVEGHDYRPVRVGVNTVMLLTPPPAAQKNPAATVTWNYDASSTRRRNMAGFDLWVELVVKGTTNRYGNW